MTFIVTGSSISGPLLIGCDPEIGAREKAAALNRAGFAEALIADIPGVQDTPGGAGHASQFLRVFRR